MKNRIQNQMAGNDARPHFTTPHCISCSRYNLCYGTGDNRFYCAHHGRYFHPGHTCAHHSALH